MTVPKTERPEADRYVDERNHRRAVSAFLDVDWYLRNTQSCARIDLDPLTHFILYGAAEGRDPNRFFDSAWYVEPLPGRGDDRAIPRCCTI